MSDREAIVDAYPEASSSDSAITSGCRRKANSISVLAEPEGSRHPSRRIMLLSHLLQMGDIPDLSQVILLGLLSLMEIPPDLQVQPEVGRDAEKSSQTK